MSSFETVVRPVVFPNIRPAPARVLPPLDDPTQGMCVIKGSGATSIGASRNWSVSLSRQLPQVEEKRQFDKERVYQTDDKGNINNSNYVDVERAYNFRFLKVEGEMQSNERLNFANPPQRDNVVTLEKGVTRNAS